MYGILHLTVIQPYYFTASFDDGELMSNLIKVNIEFSSMSEFDDVHEEFTGRVTLTTRDVDDNPDGSEDEVIEVFFSDMEIVTLQAKNNTKLKKFTFIIESVVKKDGEEIKFSQA